MPELSARFDVALAFASRLHHTQIRKEVGTPYIAHLLGVASLALEYGANEDQAIAALLHDAIEDQGGTASEEIIHRMFGHEVARIVRGCTDSAVEPKPAWRPRKEQYLAHLQTADDAIRLVSCCDKLYNARAILRDYESVGDAVFDRFTGKKDGTLWYYRALADTFLSLGPPAPARALDKTVRELEVPVFMVR